MTKPKITKPLSVFQRPWHEGPEPPSRKKYGGAVEKRPKIRVLVLALALALACAAFAETQPKPSPEVTQAQLTHARAINALYRAELAKAQIIEAQRNMQAAQVDAQRLTEEYKLAEAAALKAMGKSPDLFTLNAETGQAMPKEQAKK